jgi:hypothetical protein
MFVKVSETICKETDTKRKEMDKAVGQFKYRSPHVAVEWLALLLRIRKVPGSNLGPEIGCPD